MLHPLRLSTVLVFSLVLTPYFTRAEGGFSAAYLLPTNANKTEALDASLGLGKRKSSLSRDFIDRTLAPLAANVRAQLDWITFTAQSGQKLTLPKVLFLKYPIRVSAQSEGIKIELSEGDAQRYLKEFAKEGIPLKGIVLNAVTDIQFFNSGQVFAKLRSVKRSDPVLIRGEKGFIQFCLACHYPKADFVDDRKKLEKFWADGKHPVVTPYIELDPSLKQAIKTYTNL